MLEKTIEKHLRKVAVNSGLTPYKFVSPNHRGVPDQLVLGSLETLRSALYDVTGVILDDAGLRCLMASVVQFAECKREGEKPTVIQQREHARLQKMGFTVNVVDSCEAAAKALGLKS